MTSSSDKISQLQEQIAQLKNAALKELEARRIEIGCELEKIEAELQKLTGKTPMGRARRRIADHAFGRSTRLCGKLTGR